MNRGINNGYGCVRGHERRGRTGYWLTSSAAVRTREKLLRQFIRSPGSAPAATCRTLSGVLDRLKKARKNAAEGRTEATAVRKDLKENPVAFDVALRRHRNARQKLWRLMRDVRRHESALMSIPIVPLIIPTPLDIN